MPSVEYEYDEMTLIEAEITVTNADCSTPRGLLKSKEIKVTEIKVIIWNWNMDTDITSGLSDGMKKYFKDWVIEKYQELNVEAS